MLINVGIKIREIVAEIRRGLQKIYGEQLDQIILFGSQARGDAQPDSDIDILIVLKGYFNYSQESDRISILIANLCLEYSVLISCVFTNSEKFQHHNNAFFRNIRREGLPV
jgi:predicted nucleotidyltransferase